MNDALKFMEEQGCDVTTGLHRLMDDEEFYISCVGEFMDDPDFQHLKVYLDTGNVSAAFDSAHTLKGVAANLSLTPLYDAICVIVEKLRGGSLEGTLDDYDAMMRVRSRLQYAPGK